MYIYDMRQMLRLSILIYNNAYVHPLHLISMAYIFLKCVSDTKIQGTIVFADDIIIFIDIKLRYIFIFVQYN